MRLIDADKLQPDRMTNRGTVAISQSQIANAPTVKPCKDAISRNNAITSICQWGTALERSGRYTITISEMKQECANMLCELPLAIVPTVCDIEQIRAEIEGDMLFYEEDNCNDKDTGFVMGLQHTLDIIDKHTK